MQEFNRLKKEAHAEYLAKLAAIRQQCLPSFRRDLTRKLIVLFAENPKFESIYFRLTLQQWIEDYKMHSYELDMDHRCQRDGSRLRWIHTFNLDLPTMADFNVLYCRVLELEYIHKLPGFDVGYDYGSKDAIDAERQVIQLEFEANREFMRAHRVKELQNLLKYPENQEMFPYLTIEQWLAYSSRNGFPIKVDLHYTERLAENVCSIHYRNPNNLDDAVMQLFKNVYDYGAFELVMPKVIVLMQATSGPALQFLKGDGDHAVKVRVLRFMY